MNTKAFYRKCMNPFRFSGRNNAWGLEIGDSGLKAVKAGLCDGDLFIEAIDRIDYSTPDREITSIKSELIREALAVFKERNVILKSDKVIVSLSGKMILSRFFTLPPIKKSRIIDALRFELQKQVPFEPDEIVWDYQRFEDDRVENKGVKIGLFATKKENIHSLLPGLEPIKLNLEAIQITPIAIYNLVHLNSGANEDVIVINVGKWDTDFIVVGRSKYWNRSIPVSEINMSLIREIQRSIGYYVSVSKGTKPGILYLMGDVFEDESKIAFVDKNLETEVKFLDLSDTIHIRENIEHVPAKKNIYGFEAALGLALQGLQLGEIKINLLPHDYVKERQISTNKLFAGIFAFAITLGFITQSIKDYREWKPLANGVESLTATLNKVKNLDRGFSDLEKNTGEEEKNLRVWESLDIQGLFWIEAMNKIIDTIPEKVYLLSIESQWSLPPSGKKDGLSGRGFFGKKEENSSDTVDTSKKVLIISIKGESYAPEVSYIEEKVKIPIAQIMLLNKKAPAFRDVRLVQGSVCHVPVIDNANMADDVVGEPISFEIQCIVNDID